MFPPTHARQNAFTLVELLVVVAIIGILASLVFTAYPKMRSSAEKAQCISNLREVGAALQSYANDHDQVLPNPMYQGQSFTYKIGSSSLAAAIAPYLGLPAATNDAQEVAILKCPAWARNPGGDASPYRLATPTVNGKTTYPFGYPASNGKAAAPVMPLPQFATRSAVNAMKDFGKAHIDHYNQLYLDWHVETIPIAPATP